MSVEAINPEPGDQGLKTDKSSEPHNLGNISEVIARAEAIIKASAEKNRHGYPPLQPSLRDRLAYLRQEMINPFQGLMRKFRGY